MMKLMLKLQIGPDGKETPVPPTGREPSKHFL